MNVSDYIFSFLKSKGVNTAFVVTGGQAMYLDDALARTSGIKTIFTHHEQSAGMSADAYSRITGRLGLAVVTAGPGAINVVNGLVGGYTDSAPMMVISGQSAYSCVEYQRESGIRQYGVQGIYIRPFVEAATKFFVTVDDPSRIKYYMEKAYHMAFSGRPGPVWIDVPLDIQRMEVPERLLMGFSPEDDGISRNERQVYIKDTINDLKKAKRPLIIAGQGVRLANAVPEFLDFVGRTKIPVVTTRLGIDIIHSDHPSYVGRPGNYGERSANFAIQNADLILVLGSRLSTSSVGHDASQFGKYAKKIVVDIDKKELEKPGVDIHNKINDDVKAFLKSLNKYLDEYSMQIEASVNWCEYCLDLKRRFPVMLSEYITQSPVNSYYFIDRLSEKADSETAILVDTGSCFHVACQTWKIKKGQRFLTTGGLSSMGYWAGGLGACAANNYKNTIIITGDGSLQMNIQEFATIKHLNKPLKIFVLNNNGYLLIRQTQHNFMQDRFFGEGPETGVECPDTLKIAEAYGIKAFRIENVSEVDSIIQEVLNYDGPVICDVMSPEWQLIIPRISSEKLADGSLVSRKYEDMFPYLSDSELKEIMIAEK